MREDVAAIVLTFQRPRLATQVVRSLIEDEGFPPDRVLLVVNGSGGLTERALERRIEVLELPSNLGPAGGYRAALLEARRRFDASWYYLNEDDIGLLSLPTPRVESLIRRVEAMTANDGDPRPVGGIVAYARQLDPATGLTTPLLPSGDDLVDVDVAAWGSSLVSRALVDAGILPDDEWFFGYEDFDFWLRVRRAGFRLLVDEVAASAVVTQVAGDGRSEALAADRPLDREEPWRAYYQARNFMELRRRHGHAGWTRTHLKKSVRRFLLADAPGTRFALIHGLVDGARGRMGKRERYQRKRGEHPA